MELNEITKIIIGKAIEVHKHVGPGLLENAYKECLYYELTQAGVRVQKEQELLVRYKNVQLDCGYRMDLVVEEKVVIEIKAVISLLPIHTAQLLTYLKQGDYKVGLLINFNVKTLKHGIKRLVNSYPY